MMDYSLETAEKTLEGCLGCNQNCDECAEIGAVLDSLMIVRHYTHEISVYEDAEEMEIERLLTA